jgi:signal transduction histidine kinase
LGSLLAFITTTSVEFQEVICRPQEMVVLSSSYTTRVLLPLSLGIVCILGILGWRQARELSRVEEIRALEELHGEFQALANDLRVMRAVWNGEDSVARSAARILLNQRDAVVKIELQYRTRKGEESRMLLRVERQGSRDTLRWNGKIPTEAHILRRPALGQCLAIQPVRTMEEVLGSREETRAGDSGRAALLYWIDESRVAASASTFPWQIWVPLVGAGLLLLLGLFGLTRRHVGRDRIAQLGMRKDLHAAQLEIRVLEESFEHRVDEATREIREVMKKLEHMTELKDGFLASVSHELRTPLTSIRSFAEILLESWYDENPETRTEFLTIIREESKRICRLINQVLDLEKIESGRMDWNLSSFDLKVLGEKTLKVQGGLTKLKSVQYELLAPEEPVLYCGDEDRLQQVLVNLLSNAWKYSPEGGRIHLMIHEFAGGVEIRIEDEGPGVPDDGTRELIFEKFHQGQVSEEGALPSTGLGLPIASEIVHMHGGWVSCSQGSLSGASFVILLPHDEGRLERALNDARQEGSVEDTQAMFRVPAAEGDTRGS